MKVETNKEKKQRLVKEVVGLIRLLEANFDPAVVESACARYKHATVEKRRAEVEVVELQKQIEAAKRRLT